MDLINSYNTSFLDMAKLFCTLAVLSMWIMTIFGLHKGCGLCGIDQSYVKITVVGSERQGISIISGAGISMLSALRHTTHNN